MTDPYLAMAMFTAAALAVGTVIFGGTTLAYVLERRASQQAEPAPQIGEPTPVVTRPERAQVQRDRAA